MFSPQFQTKPLTPIFKKAVSVVIVIPSSKQRPSSQFQKKTVFVRVVDVILQHYQIASKIFFMHLFSKENTRRYGNTDDLL